VTPPPDLTALFSEAAKLGFVVFLLLVAVVGLVKWVRGLQDRSDANALEDRKECQAREKALAERLGKVEDRQFGEHSDVLRRCASALELNARAFDKLTDSDTGLHRALADRKRGD
jgi:hypothetical protein